MSLRGGEVKAMRTYGDSSEITLVDTETTTEGSGEDGGCDDAGHFRLQMELTYATTKLSKLEAEVENVTKQRDHITRRCGELKAQLIEVYGELSAAKTQPRDAASIANLSSLNELYQTQALLAQAMQEKEAALAREHAALDEAQEAKQETIRVQEVLRISQEKNAKLDADTGAASNAHTSRETSTYLKLCHRNSALEAEKLTLTRKNEDLKEQQRVRLATVLKYRDHATFLQSKNENLEAGTSELRAKLAIAEGDHARYVKSRVA
jgi:hypothetical protein